MDAKAVGQRVLRLRRDAALSQDELAAASGVSRQAIGALEAGRHLPRVDAAVAIARALDTTVEALLATIHPPVTDVHGIELADGSLVRAAHVAEHTVAVPLIGPQDGEVWAAPDAVVHNGQARPLPGAELGALVVAGCDPALGVLASLAPQYGPRRILPISTSSATARQAIERQRAHVAIVHDATLASPPKGVHRMSLASWRTGVAAHNTATIKRALAGNGPVIQRRDGATAQAAYERALTEAGVGAPPVGPLATGHRDAARRANIDGNAAVTIEPIALATGLTFEPLETHAVEVWVAEHAWSHPGTAVLGELLAGSRLRHYLEVLPAYDVKVAL